MPWVRLDDGFADHPKLENAGPLAGWLHVAALCYSARHLTDGRVPKTKARRLTDIPSPAKHIAALLDNGLWHEDGDDYVIHDYLDYQPSRAEVEATRAVARRRSAMNANPALRDALRARDGDNCRYCGRRVSWRDRKGPAGGTYDHVTPLHTGGDESLDNLVVACRECNTRKGTRTPAEAGMTLRPPPDPPDPSPNGIKPGSRRNQGKNNPEPRHPIPSHPIPSPERDARGQHVPALALVPENGSAPPAPVQDHLPTTLIETRPTRYSHDFEAWWQLYPVKKGKDEALREWNRARGRATWKQLHDGLKAAVAAWEAEGIEPRYIPRAAKWLHGGHWADEHTEPDKPRPKSAAALDRVMGAS